METIDCSSKLCPAGSVVMKVECKMSSTPQPKQPLKVIADSNAFFVPLQFNIDIFAELERVLNRRFELVLISPVKRELETLAKKSTPRIQKNVAFALKLAQKCVFFEMPKKKNEPVDDAIARAAEMWNAPVFTNDKLLKMKLRDISIPVIYVRQKSRLEIDGSIP